MTQYLSQVIGPIQIVNNIRIIAIPHRRTGSARRGAPLAPVREKGAVRRTAQSLIVWLASAVPLQSVGTSVWLLIV